MYHKGDLAGHCPIYIYIYKSTRPIFPIELSIYDRILHRNIDVANRNVVDSAH